MRVVTQPAAAPNWNLARDVIVQEVATSTVQGQLPTHDFGHRQGRFVPVQFALAVDRARATRSRVGSTELIRSAPPAPSVIAASFYMLHAYRQARRSALYARSIFLRRAFRRRYQAEEASIRLMGRMAMELNQVSYFINLAETLNFTAAARLSGVSQPSLTRAIRRLEDELGGPLTYRDGKNSRLTGLGQDVKAEFQRMVVAMKSVRNHSENWATGRHRVLDVAVAPTVGPKEFTAFFESALAELPSIEIKLHALQSNEDASAVLSGKYQACILARETRPEPKLDVLPLFRERFVLGCSANHPLAVSEIVRGEDLLEFPFVDRLNCEFRDQILDHFARRDLHMRPRFRSDREDWLQRVVADGYAICILPERSATAHRLVTRPIDGLVLEREVVMATVSGSTATVEIRKIAQLAAGYEWN